MESNAGESQLVEMSKTFALFNSKVEGEHNIELKYRDYKNFDELDNLILRSFCCLPKEVSSKRPIQDLSKMSARTFLECSDSCTK